MGQRMTNYIVLYCILKECKKMYKELLDSCLILGTNMKIHEYNTALDKKTIIEKYNNIIHINL